MWFTTDHQGRFGKLSQENNQGILIRHQHLRMCACCKGVKMLPQLEAFKNDLNYHCLQMYITFFFHFHTCRKIGHFRQFVYTKMLRKLCVAIWSSSKIHDYFYKDLAWISGRGLCIWLFLTSISWTYLQLPTPRKLYSNTFNFTSLPLESSDCTSIHPGVTFRLGFLSFVLSKCWHF